MARRISFKQGTGFKIPKLKPLVQTQDTKDITVYKPGVTPVGTGAYNKAKSELNLPKVNPAPKVAPTPRTVVRAQLPAPRDHSYFVKDVLAKYSTTVAPKTVATKPTTVAAKTVAAKSTTPVVKK